MRKAAIFNYNSIFAENIEETIKRYNPRDSAREFSVNMYSADEHRQESIAGEADIIIHSGGDGIPVQENIKNIPKLYICYSHQWKAKREGGTIVRLKDFIKGVRLINVLEDDEILGRRGNIPIMQYHEFAVSRSPGHAKVLATSRAKAENGEEIEIIEALRYPDGSMSIQGHPEEGTAEQILHNFLKFIIKIKEQMGVAYGTESRDI